MAADSSWSQLLVRWGNQNEDEFDMEKKSPFITDTYKITVEHEYKPITSNLNPDLIARCVKFNAVHGLTANGNGTMLSVGNMTRFQQLGSYCIRVEKDGDLLGFLLTVPVDFKYKDYTGRMMYTTFLCVHLQHRTGGLAMLLIRKCAQLGSILGIFSGYQMVPRAIGASPVIDIWYRPINYDKAKQAGYQLNNYNRHTDRGINRNHQIYNNNMPINCMVEIDTIEQSYDVYLSLIKNHTSTVLWNPNMSTWMNWQSYAPVLTLRCKDKVIGQCSFVHRRGLISTTNSKIHIAEISWFLCDIEDRNTVFRMVCSYLQKSHFDIIQWYSINGQYDELGKYLHGMKSDVRTYWLLYNWHHYPENYCLPLM